MKKLILASGSPRRKELLGNMGYEFEVITSEVDETLNVENDLVEEIKKLYRIRWNKETSFLIVKLMLYLRTIVKLSLLVQTPW